LIDYKEILKYINTKNSSNKNIEFDENDNNDHIELKYDNIDKIKNEFNILYIQNSSMLSNAIDNSLNKIISNELSIAKNFYTCIDATTCHLKLYYIKHKYKFEITDKYLKYLKKYLSVQMYKYFFLDLFNFDFTDVIINYSEKIKDVIPIIHDFTMIDFFIDESINIDSYRLKAFIYNEKSKKNKINQIKLIKFKNFIHDVDIYNINITNNDLKNIYIEPLMNINTSNFKPQQIKNNFCDICFYRNYCYKTTPQKNPANSSGYNNIKHEFLL